MTKSPKLPRYSKSIAGTLLAAREAVMSPIRPVLREAGVTEQQWRVLRVLLDEGAVDASQLARSALLWAPSITRILRELTDRGLIERQPDPDDGRRSILAISKNGQKLVEETAAQTLRLIDGFERRFGKERLSELLVELRAFVEAITTAQPD